MPPHAGWRGGRARRSGGRDHRVPEDLAHSPNERFEATTIEPRSGSCGERRLRAVAAPPRTPYSSNTGWKPPQNIRLPSKGISISIISESAAIFSFAASRVALSGYSIQLKMTVSSSFA